MAKAPEKKVEPKQKVDIKALVPYVADLIVIHQFLQAVHSSANPAIAKELERVKNELIEALSDA